MSAFDFVASINYDVKDYVEHLEDARPEDIGLDRRASPIVYIDDDAIIVPKHADRNMQYYGGFEYVDKEHRAEVGEYVFYFDESNRVSKCLEFYHSKDEDEDEV